MLNNYTFAGVNVSFNDFASNNLLSQWQWKLNPYFNVNASQSPRSISIFQRKDVSEPVNYEDLLLLREEPSKFFQRQVYSLNDGGTLWQFIRKNNHKVYLQLKVSPSWDQVELLVDETATAGQAAFEYLGQLIPYALIPHEIITFHGVLMEHDGHGIIIAAPSGTGKTTHARLWRDYKNALIINGDRATCKKTESGWTGFGLPWSGSSGEQVNRNVPVKTLVILERGETNEAKIAGGLESFGKALPHLQTPVWDQQLSSAALDLFDDFLKEVPCIHLKCRPDQDAVHVLHKLLKEVGV